MTVIEINIAVSGGLMYWQNSKYRGQRAIFSPAPQPLPNSLRGQRGPLYLLLRSSGKCRVPPL